MKQNLWFALFYLCLFGNFLDWKKTTHYLQLIIFFMIFSPEFSRFCQPVKRVLCLLFPSKHYKSLKIVFGQKMGLAAHWSLRSNRFFGLNFYKYLFIFSGWFTRDMTAPLLFNMFKKNQIPAAVNPTKKRRCGVPLFERQVRNLTFWFRFKMLIV